MREKQFQKIKEFARRILQMNEIVTRRIKNKPFTLSHIRTKKFFYYPNKDKPKMQWMKFAFAIFYKFV